MDGFDPDTGYDRRDPKYGDRRPRPSACVLCGGIAGHTPTCPEVNR